MRTLLTFGLAVILIVVAIKVEETVEKVDKVNYRDLYRTTTVYGVIQENFKGYTEVKTVTDNITKEEKEDKKKLQINKHLDKVNEDYLGSIEIPALETTEPIYKSKGDYYLNHNYKKESYEPGEVYLDERTGESILTTGALLNGHAVPNGTKFGKFKKLLDLKEQPKVLIWDEDTKSTVIYKMLFISLIDGDNSGIIMKFKDEEQRLKYYNNLYSTSVKKWEEPKEKRTFLLLNSCAYIIQDGHYVVVAQKEE